ncbi:MAG: hypothetical protein ABFS21_07965 [Actinomycetota bacterium]
MSKSNRDKLEQWSQTGRRVGYVVAVVINVVLIFVVVNLLSWGWLPFLTEDFENLLPILILSLLVSGMVNLAWIVYDPRWFRAAGQIVDNLTSLLVVVVTYKVFPFDFSPYRINWETIVRVVIVLTAFALVIATIAEFVKLIRSLANLDSEPTPT